jgi:2-keto-4-pentenoate hydratase
MAGRDLDAPVKAGLERQLEGWRNLLEGGAERLGWKIGLNVPELQQKLGLSHSVIGFLTSASRLEDGASHSAGGMVKPLVEPEVAVTLRREVQPGAAPDEALAAIESLGPAIELVDIPSPPDDVEETLAGNVFHRAVVLGPHRQDAAVGGVVAGVRVNGEERESAPADVDLAATIALVADLLGAVGERLQSGDTIICGSLTPPVPVGPGDEVEVELGSLGQARLELTQ